MGYPTFEQYNDAFQAHQRLLVDPELQRGVVAKTGMGTPLALSGGFARPTRSRWDQRNTQFVASTGSSRPLKGGTRQ